MESYQIEQSTGPTIEKTRDLDELLTAIEINQFISTPEFVQSTYNEKITTLASYIKQARINLGFDIPQFNHDPIAYENWDLEQAQKIVSAQNAEIGQAQMEAILPETKPEEPTAEIVDMGHLAETQKVDMGKELADYEMSKMYPETPEKIFTRTTAERYSDLVTKAEAKAREYEQKVTLTPVETKRLDEIRADIAYFSEKMKAAIAVEQSKKAPIETIETPTIEPIPAERTAEIVRTELQRVTEGPPQLIPKAEKVIEPAPTNTDSEPDVEFTETPPKRSLWSRFVSNFKLESETPIKSPEPVPLTPRERILQSAPLKPVDNINRRGIPINGQ